MHVKHKINRYCPIVPSSALFSATFVIPEHAGIKNFSYVVNRVSFGKESIILTRRGEEIAALVAIDELRLLQELEDRIDIADAMKAIKEQGEDIPAEQFWKKLGL